MAQINDLIEWGDCGSQYSLYLKHFVDEEGKRGLKMIYEDLTRDKVTEIVIPTNKYPIFKRMINGPSSALDRIFQ